MTSLKRSLTGFRSNYSRRAHLICLLSALGAMSTVPMQAQTETVLHNFESPSNGAFPEAGVIRDLSGNFYGITSAGGTGNCNCGVVYTFNAAGQEKVLHTFTGGADGSTPYAGVARDSKGNLYGTTTIGRRGRRRRVV
jgi:uncharacterized repeat protein (TIGR03803 family)